MESWKNQPAYIPEFFPAYSFESVVEAYAVLDGIPGYLRKFDDKLTIFENIKQKVLSKGEFLYEEPRFMLS